eukprot:scaffold5472_cov146-Skeletonema_menzelii.AAC.9
MSNFSKKRCEKAVNSVTILQSATQSLHHLPYLLSLILTSLGGGHPAVEKVVVYKPHDNRNSPLFLY